MKALSLSCLPSLASRLSLLSRLLLPCRTPHMSKLPNSQKVKHLLLLLLTLTTLPAAPHDIEHNGISYSIIATDQVAVQQAETPYEGYIALPDTIQANGQRYAVTTIAPKAFSHCSKLTSVNLPATLLVIGPSAFAGCTSLPYITLPEKLLTIGDAAFSGCTQIRSITIPASVKSVGCQAFAKCSQLSRFIVDHDNTTYAAHDGILMSQDLTRVVAFPPANNSAPPLPATTRQIDSCAFAYCDKLIDITLPEGLEIIQAAAFYQCESLSRVSLPTTLQTIGMYAFSECGELTSISIPQATRQIGDGAFSFCEKLQNVFVNNGNTSFSASDGILMSADQRVVVAVPGGRQGSYRIPATADSIASQAFYGCHELESITLPSHLANIGDNPFLFCESLKEINVSNDNTAFQSLDGVLLNADKTAIMAMPKAKQGAYAVPEGIATIEGGTFLNNAGLTSLSLPSSLTTIADYAFLGCYSLASVNLPQSLTSLGAQAFDDCTDLSQIICAGSPISVAQHTAPDSPFASSTFEKATLFVPKGTLSDYMSHGLWSSFVNTSEYGIFAQDQKANRYAWQRLSVGVTPSLPITALQAQLSLPDGFELCTDSNGNPIVELQGDNALTHQATLRPIGGTTPTDGDGAAAYRLSVFDQQRRPLAATDTLLFILLRSPQDSPAGTYGIRLSDIMLTYATDGAHGETQQKDFEAGLDLKPYSGDVNRNGRVNVADAVETICYTMGTPTEQFHFDEADVNSNGTVNMADALQTIDIIRQSACNFFISPLEWDMQHGTTVPHLAVADGRLAIDATTPFHVTLRHEDANLTAHQFVITLPRGIQLEQDADGKFRCTTSTRYANASLMLSIDRCANDGSATDGNAYSVVVASMDNSAIMPGEGTLLTLFAHVDETLGEGQYEGTLSHIVFADTDAREMMLDYVPFHLFVTTAAGIHQPQATPQHRPVAIYNLQGQKMNKAAGNHPLAPGIYIVDGKKVVIK